MERFYIVACKSRLSGRESICKDESGNVLTFKTEDAAEEFARESREFMSINYHYWVEER